MALSVNWPFNCGQWSSHFFPPVGGIMVAGRGASTYAARFGRSDVSRFNEVTACPAGHGSLAADSFRSCSAIAGVMVLSEVECLMMMFGSGASTSATRYRKVLSRNNEVTATAVPAFAVCSLTSESQVVSER